MECVGLGVCWKLKWSRLNLNPNFGFGQNNTQSFDGVNDPLLWLFTHNFGCIRKLNIAMHTARGQISAIESTSGAYGVMYDWTWHLQSVLSGMNFLYACIIIFEMLLSTGSTLFASPSASNFIWMSPQCTLLHQSNLWARRCIKTSLLFPVLMTCFLESHCCWPLFVFKINSCWLVSQALVPRCWPSYGIIRTAIVKYALHVKRNWSLSVMERVTMLCRGKQCDLQTQDGPRVESLDLKSLSSGFVCCRYGDGMMSQDRGDRGPSGGGSGGGFRGGGSAGELWIIHSP